MSGIDPYAYMQKVSENLQVLTSRSEIETVLDEMEYLFEVISPEMQDDAEKLIELLRHKLEYAD